MKDGMEQIIVLKGQSRGIGINEVNDEMYDFPVVFQRIFPAASTTTKNDNKQQQKRVKLMKYIGCSERRLIGHRFLPLAASCSFLRKPRATCREKGRHAAPCTEKLRGRLISLHNEYGVQPRSPVLILKL
jgi:hypothetical protein